MIVYLKKNPQVPSTGSGDKLQNQCKEKGATY
jgi:hypothetical protein